MNDWRDEERAADAAKRNLLIGVGAILAVMAWMFFTLPGDELPSSRGFNLGAGEASNAPTRPFMPRNQKTGLDFVGGAVGEGPASVRPGELPGPPPEPASAPEAATPAAAPPEPAASADDDAKALASAGIPSDPRGLKQLGAAQGLLSVLAGKMLDHPKVLKAIFNNKTVVDAFMNRDVSKKNCESGGALKSYLSDPKSGGMTKVLPVIQAALNRPEAASALAGTEMAKRVLNCPSVSAIAKDPSAVMGIVVTNGKALGVLSDPRMAQALAANPEAAGILAGVQAAIGGVK